MKILVTGAAGFLGSHLCDRLLADGHIVTGIDNLFTGRLRNLSEAMRNPSFKFHEHDVQAPFAGDYDRIFHLASPASPPHYQLHPIETAKTNFLGTLNALELARKTNARILLTSTSEIYGDPLQHPQTEAYFGNVNPIGPRSCYDEGKRIAETLAFDFKRVHGIEIRVARVFNCYGPRMNPMDGRVVSNFITQALQGHDITIYGDGSQTRSFCHVADLIDGLVALMECDSVETPVNIGNPEEITVGDVARIVIAMTGSRSQVVTRELPQDDPKRRKPDITRAQNELHWTPRIPFREGLVSTVDYFRTYYADAVA